MRIAIHGRDPQHKTTRFIEKIVDILLAHKADILVSEKFLHSLRSPKLKKLKLKSFTHKVNLSKVDFFLSIGGDGTLLESVTYVGRSGVPILGVNTGRLGFLATTNREDIEQALDDLFSGNFKIDQRILLRLESSEPIFEGMSFALNDFTIMKSDSSSMITVHVDVDGQLLNSYWADGIIVATPTGSTGYSLSCGGPLVYPQSDSFVITPVSPHTLTARPIVLSDSSEISFRIEGRSKKFLVSLDSRYQAVDAEIRLTIRKEKFSIRLVMLPGSSYFNTLRQKLNWGLDVRN